MATLTQHRRALAQHHRKVERDLARYRASVRARNDAVRAAKADGLPAAEAYDLAAVSQSTFSRQQDAGDAAP
jgi:hypothetical protein